MKPFLAVLKRDLRLALRHGSDTATVLAFFVIAVTLFPFGVGPEAETLSRIAGGIIWVSALLAALLSLDRLFQGDYEDGALDELLLAPLAPSLMVAAKCLAHWLTTGLPLVLLSPLLALILSLPEAALPALVGSLLLGTPVLTLAGSIGAALVLGARRGGVLLSLLILPLYIPVLIFGVGAVEAAATGQAARPHLLLLGACFLGSLAAAPFVAGAALRQGAE
jgi:heme exporter protein B